MKFKVLKDEDPITNERGVRITNTLKMLAIIFYLPMVALVILVVTLVACKLVVENRDNNNMMTSMAEPLINSEHTASKTMFDINCLLEIIASETTATSLSTDLLISDTGLSISLDRRASWVNSLIYGAISTFGLAVTGANILYAAACIPTFLNVFDLAIPGAHLERLTSYFTAGAFIVVANFASYSINAYHEDGGWKFDSAIGIKGNLNN